MFLKYRSRFATIALTASFVAAAPSAEAQSTRTLNPTYSFSFMDAVTGTNCTGMTQQGGCTGSGWFVTPGADVYANDVYERPTSQTYTGSTPVAKEYLGYLDLVTAKYGFDQRYMYFQLNMYSPFLYKNDGTVDKGVFGSGTYYGVQLGSNNANDGQLLLRTEETSLGANTAVFDGQKTQGWFDQNNSVSGPGGVNTPNEEGTWATTFNGYERQVIKTDGYLDGTSTYVLFSRAFVNELGQATVELALDYVAFNSYCVGRSLACSLTPSELPYFVFEATRGLKDPQNYLWNDKYNATEAGTPYTTAGLGNIYELDNMRVSYLPVAVPEPSSFGLTLGGLLALAMAARRRQMRKR
jgi:hypothetical protein